MKLKTRSTKVEKEPAINRPYWRRQARLEAGLTVTQAAKKANICEDYLKRVERKGGASWVLAMRLAHIYKCSANLFL